jgi:hypothetical protein
LSPLGTDACDEVPWAVMVFHQVRFSPTPTPNQRTRPFSTRVVAALGEDVFDAAHQVGGGPGRRRGSRAADLLVGVADEDQVAGRAARRPRLSAIIAMSWMIPWPFMSSAPRPQTAPSRISPANGSTCHSPAFAGTTSM